MYVRSSLSAGGAGPLPAARRCSLHPRGLARSLTPGQSKDQHPIRSSKCSTYVSPLRLQPGPVCRNLGASRAAQLPRMSDMQGGCGSSALLSSCSWSHAMMVQSHIRCAFKKGGVSQVGIWKYPLSFCWGTCSSVSQCSGAENMPYSALLNPHPPHQQPPVRGSLLSAARPRISAGGTGFVCLFHILLLSVH